MAHFLRKANVFSPSSNCISPHPPTLKLRRGKHLPLRGCVGGNSDGELELEGEGLISRRGAEKQRAQRLVATKNTKNTKMILELGFHPRPRKALNQKWSAYIRGMGAPRLCALCLSRMLAHPSGSASPNLPFEAKLLRRISSLRENLTPNAS